MEQTSMIISDLIHKIKDLKDKYNYYKRVQGNAKRELLLYDPYDNLTKEQHENYYHSIIGDCRYLLNKYQNEIKETRKQIKKLNREQNLRKIIDSKNNEIQILASKVID